MLKVVYTIFLGALIALFVGWGIEVFYNSPKMPEYPITYEKAGELSEEEQAKQDNYDKDFKSYQEKMKVYNRNISVIGMVISVLLFIISLVFLKKIQFISDSVLLGGAFSMIYSVTRGMMSENSKVQFLTVTVGLIVALIVGSVKFVKNDESIKKSA